MTAVYKETIIWLCLLIPRYPIPTDSFRSFPSLTASIIRIMSKAGEKYDEEEAVKVGVYDATHVDIEEAPIVAPEDLHRNLKSRHASMLAVGGAIGTGLIIGSGTGLARAGPVGLLIAFVYVGSLCFSMMVVSAPYEAGARGY
jgi:amino acid permease